MDACPLRASIVLPLKQLVSDLFGNCLLWCKTDLIWFWSIYLVLYFGWSIISYSWFKFIVRPQDGWMLLVRQFEWLWWLIEEGTWNKLLPRRKLCLPINSTYLESREKKKARWHHSFIHSFIQLKSVHTIIENKATDVYTLVVNSQPFFSQRLWPSQPSVYAKHFTSLSRQISLTFCSCNNIQTKQKQQL